VFYCNKQNEQHALRIFMKWVGSQGVLERRSVANSYWWYCPYTWQNFTHL